MGKYIFKRILAMVPVVLLVTFAVFILSYVAAGDAARVIAEKRYEHPSVAQVEQIRHEEGLDRPLLVQYGSWLNKVLHGDFGTSYISRKPAFSELRRRVPATAKLAVTALTLLLIVSIPLGVISAVYEGSLFDRIVQGLSFFSVSMPAFWMGLMLLYLFGVKLNAINVIGGTKGLPIIPALAMDATGFGILIRMVRTNMLQALKKDYIRAEKAKGMSGAVIVLKHCLKNTSIPVTTRLVSTIIGMFCGSAIIEEIFSIRGIGKMALDAVHTKDAPVLECFILVLAIAVVLINLAVDILYSLIDRRIQLK